MRSAEGKLRYFGGFNAQRCCFKPEPHSAKKCYWVAQCFQRRDRVAQQSTAPVLRRVSGPEIENRPRQDEEVSSSLRTVSAEVPHSAGCPTSRFLARSGIPRPHPTGDFVDSPHSFPYLKPRNLPHSCHPEQCACFANDNSVWDDRATRGRAERCILIDMWPTCTTMLSTCQR